MTRIDWLLTKRIGGRVLLTLTMVFGLLCLVESINTWRFNALAANGGWIRGFMGIITHAGVWLLATLPITVLVGAIAGLLDLQARREMTIIRAAGASVWRTLRFPVLGTLALGAFVAFAADPALVSLMRSFTITPPDARAAGSIWLEQHAGQHRYIVYASRPRSGGQLLEDATFFLPAQLGGPRIVTPRAQLIQGAWRVAEGTRFTPDGPAEEVTNLRIPTQSSRSDMRARMVSASEFTLFELSEIASRDLTDRLLRSGVETRMMRLLALPLALGASMLIAFAFTSGYRRSNKYGSTVLYGIVLGFVLYVVTELAATAGSAGLIEPVYAAFGPALAAVGVGVTVLLFREDGLR